MKKLVYLFVSGLMFNSIYAVNSYRPAWRLLDEPVKITVRGVDFFIFPSGAFDFNTHQRHNPYYYTPGEYGIRIEKDRYGKIRRVGNVFINYNRYGQVRRLGNVFISYNYQGYVRKIGHLHLRYFGNKYRVIRYRPQSYFSSSYYYGPSGGYQSTPNYYYHDDWENYEDENTWENEDNDYYFRGKKKDKTKGRRH